MPTRIFHWTLVLAIAGSWWTAENDDSERHAIIGYIVLALLLFRLGWGMIGSDTARFGSFLRPPSEAFEHLRHLLRPGKLAPHVGHNALGGYSVALLLLSLAVQVGTGLFLYDDEYFWAPLNGWIGEDAAEALGDIHEANFNLLLALIALHVAAVLFYGIVKGLDLVRPMLSGRADLPRGAPAPWIAPIGRALPLAVLAALSVWGLVSLA